MSVLEEVAKGGGKLMLDHSIGKNPQAEAATSLVGYRPGTGATLAKAQQGKQQVDQLSTLDEQKKMTDSTNKDEKGYGKIGSLDLSEKEKERIKKVRDKFLELEKSADDDDTPGIKDYAKYTAGVAGATVGADLMRQGIGKMKDKYQTESTWKKIKEQEPDLASEENRPHFEVLQDFAPSLAKNPTVARSYLERADKYDMTPHEFVQDLADTESEIQKGRDSASTQDIMEMGTNMAQQHHRMNKESNEPVSKTEALKRRLEQVDPRS